MCDVRSFLLYFVNNLINKHRKKLVFLFISLTVYVIIKWHPDTWTQSGSSEAVPLVTHSNTSQFMLAIGYWEQLQNAMNSFSHLSLLSADFNRSAVLPYARDSMLFGVPSCSESESAVHSLKLYFSLSRLTQLLKRHTGGHTDTFHTFLRASPARIQLGLYLYAPSNAEEWLSPGEVTDQLIQSLNTQPALECTAFLKDSRVSSLVTDLNSWNVSRGRFYVHSAICLNPFLSLTTKQLSGMFHRIGEGQSSSLLFNEWRGVVGMSDKSHKRIRFVDTRSLTFPPWPLSQQVLTASERYFRSRNLTRPLIGLHVRLEKLALLAQYSSIPPAEFVSRCLSELATHLEVLVSRAGNHSLLSVSDLSPYGTQSCRQCKQGMWALQLFRENGYAFSEYEPGFGAGQTDAGFVSLVEMEVLARAQFLVLLGGGAFQKQLVARFSQKLGANTSLNENMRLKRICASHYR